MTSERVTGMQDVYDLIIATCQESPEFHAWGASALRYLNRAAQAGGTAETTQIGSVHEHAVVADDAPKGESS